VITKVPLEDPGDGWLREADKRALKRIEAQAGLDKPGVGDLDEILLVLSATQELSSKSLGQPQM
jgi:hypothetical protein